VSSEWYLETTLGDVCCYDTHCKDCKPNGDCEQCDTIDGRFMEAVNEYASTCDVCGELTSHEQFAYVDPDTQLGCCDECFQKGQLP
jgi:hypothetical protein